jgi:hypothetical protein
MYTFVMTVFIVQMLTTGLGVVGFYTTPQAFSPIRLLLHSGLGVWAAYLLFV